MIRYMICIVSFGMSAHSPMRANERYGADWKNRKFDEFFVAIDAQDANKVRKLLADLDSKVGASIYHDACNAVYQKNRKLDQDLCKAVDGQRIEDAQKLLANGARVESVYHNALSDAVKLPTEIRDRMIQVLYEGAKQDLTKTICPKEMMGCCTSASDHALTQAACDEYASTVQLILGYNIRPESALIKLREWISMGRAERAKKGEAFLLKQFELFRRAQKAKGSYIESSLQPLAARSLRLGFTPNFIPIISAYATVDSSELRMPVEKLVTVRWRHRWDMEEDVVLS